MRYTWGTATASGVVVGAVLLALLCSACSGSAAGMRTGQSGLGGAETTPLTGSSTLAMQQTPYGTLPLGVSFEVLPATFAQGGCATLTTHTAAEAAPTV